MDAKKADPINDLSSDELKMITIVHSSITGASVAAVVQLGGREALSTVLLASLAAFAINIPISLLVVLLLYFRAFDRNRAKNTGIQPEFWPSTGLVQFLRYISYTTCFGGFLGLFWSFHIALGITFLLSTAIALGTALAAENRRPAKIIPISAVEESAGNEDGIPVDEAGKRKALKVS